LPIIDIRKKTKHPTKGKKKVQDERTQVLANEESSYLWVDGKETFRV
jgi:hypothetical protein